MAFAEDVCIQIEKLHQAADGSYTGPPVDLTAASSNAAAENDFMSAGGDGYPNFFSRATTQDIIHQVLADYIAANMPVSQPFRDESFAQQAEVEAEVVIADSWAEK